CDEEHAASLVVLEQERTAWNRSLDCLHVEPRAQERRRPGIGFADLPPGADHRMLGGPRARTELPELPRSNFGHQLFLREPPRVPGERPLGLAQPSDVLSKPVAPAGSPRAVL